MHVPYDLIVTIICSVFASTGFWAFVTTHLNKRNAQARMLRGLAHDRICCLGQKYIDQGYIKQGELENLMHYLYEPYKELGGNGTAKRIMEEVCELPIKN